MAPYNPPSAHYAHLDVSLFDNDMIDKFIGERGTKFYELTRRLKVKYIWWNRESKFIEVWGPYESFRDHKPIDVIRHELNQFVQYIYFGKNMS